MPDQILQLPTLIYWTRIKKVAIENWSAKKKCLMALANGLAMAEFLIFVVCLLSSSNTG